jgi:SHS2 domain-containing protein
VAVYLNMFIYLENVCSYGELWNKAKHIQGTEIKAITYSNMRVCDRQEKNDIYVIVDI